MPAYSLSPATQTVAANVFGTITLTMTPPVGFLQNFDFDDAGAGGTFSYSSPMVVGVFAASKIVQYKHTVAGTYTITFTPSTGPLSGEPAQSVEFIVSGGAAGARHPRLVSVRNMGMSIS